MKDQVGLNIIYMDPLFSGVSTVMQVSLFSSAIYIRVDQYVKIQWSHCHKWQFTDGLVNKQNFALPFSFNMH